MKAKKRASSAHAIEQAELILKLYELRRETVMREARSYVGGEFRPASMQKGMTATATATVSAREAAVKRRRA